MRPSVLKPSPAIPAARARRWRSQSFRRLAYQVFAILIIAAAIVSLVLTTAAHMHARGIHSGFDFISQPAGFSIGESIVPFDSSESFGKAFLVGLSNTLRVSVPGIVLATLLGAIIGIGRQSPNWLVRTLCKAYVDMFRNVPLLLQLFIWYFVLTELLPSVDEALRLLPDVYLSKNGLQFAIPVWSNGHFSLDIPEKTAISMIGGGAVTPEYLTMLIGLVVYTAAYIAEVVRAGIQSVAQGQLEACMALGMSRKAAMRLVQLPQALRVIIPPLTNQYVNIVKNSSLAVAVGYPDLVSVSNTSLNQTGRAVECISIVMACYLTVSLLASFAMSVYNRRAGIWGKR